MIDSKLISNAHSFGASADSNSCVLDENGHLVTLATNSTLLEDQHRELATVVKMEVQKPTRLVEDLRSAGLTRTLDGLGTIVAEYEREGDITGAQVDMDGRSTAQADQVEFDLDGVPVPITHKSFTLNIRQQLASTRGGRQSYDTRMARLAATKIGQANEQMIVDGVSGIKVLGREVFGYRTHPNRMTGTIADWALTATTGETIVGNSLDIVDDFRSKYLADTITFYVAEDVWANLQTDYSDTKGSNTKLERLLQIEQIASVRPSYLLANGEVLAVTLNANTVELAIAQDTSLIQWGANPMQTEFKVMNALVPVLMPTKAGTLGVAQYNKA